MSSTSAQIGQIRQIQGALSVLAALNLCGEMYPQEETVCNGATYDYIVVGGGNSGLVVAARLVEAAFNVLVIEAGGNPGLENESPGLSAYIKESRFDWNFTAERNCQVNRCHKADSRVLFGKALGGSGATGYMIYERGNPRDYEKFYEATNDKSYKWQNMLKYFIKSENLHSEEILNSPFKKYHGTKGRIGVTKENRPVCDDYLQGFEEAGEALVVDNVGAAVLGYSSGLYHILGGVRNHVANTYLRRLKSNPKLHVTRNSLATKIIFDEKKNAVGVTFIKEGKTITVKARKEIIICAGTIKSPQLLMLSGIGPKEELEKLKIKVLSNLPVGKNLQNSVGIQLGFKTNRKVDPKPSDVHQFPTPLIVGYSALNKSSRYPDYATLNYIIDDYKYLLTFCGFTLGFKNSICDRLHSLAGNNQMLVTNLININPKSRGEVLLNSTDPHDQPKIFNRYYSHKSDLEASVNYIQDFLKIEKAPIFQSIHLEFLDATKECDQYEFGSNEFFKCYALCMSVPSWRHTGTCSMGSVVDNKLCVKGVNGLRVVGASVMPKTLGGATFAPEVALAEKAAEMIIEDDKD